MLHNTMTDNCLILLCIVEGLPSSRAFEIEVSAIRTIAHLKNLVKTIQTPAFDDITVDQLTLWHVSIPVTNNSDIPILLDNVTSDKKNNLGPATKLLKEFSGLPEQMIHIIVQRPPQGKADTLRFLKFNLRIGLFIVLTLTLARH